MWQLTTTTTNDNYNLLWSKSGYSSILQLRKLKLMEATHLIKVIEPANVYT